jgi:hypothetical protein
MMRYFHLLIQIFTLTSFILFAHITYAAENENAHLKLRAVYEEKIVTQVQADTTFTLDILVQNPNKIAIESVQSWITYDSNNIRIENVQSDSDFDLVTPGENTFNENTIKIGRAILEKEPLTQELILVARITLTALNTQKTNFVFEEDHRSINIVSDDFKVINVLGNAENLILNATEPIRNSVSKEATQYDQPQDNTSNNTQKDTSPSSDVLIPTDTNNDSIVTYETPYPTEDTYIPTIDVETALKKAANENVYNDIIDVDTKQYTNTQENTQAEGNVRIFGITQEDKGLRIIWDNKNNYTGYYVYISPEQNEFFKKIWVSKGSNSLLINNIPFDIPYYISMSGISLHGEETAQTEKSMFYLTEGNSTILNSWTKDTTKVQSDINTIQPKELTQTGFEIPFMATLISIAGIAIFGCIAFALRYRKRFIL